GEQQCCLECAIKQTKARFGDCVVSGLLMGFQRDGLRERGGYAVAMACHMADLPARQQSSYHQTGKKQAAKHQGQPEIGSVHGASLSNLIGSRDSKTGSGLTAMGENRTMTSLSTETSDSASTPAEAPVTLGKSDQNLVWL